MIETATKINSLNGIEKTLIIPLWARATESKYGNLIRDELSEKWINRFDLSKYKLEQYSPFVRNYLLTAMANRKILIDSYLNSTVNKNSTVINLGCGLDTRFSDYTYKVKQWYDVDLPEVIEIRKSLCTEKANYEMIPASIFNENLFDRFKYEEDIIFICEGVLMYYDESQVKEFFNNLIGNTTSGNIILDSLGTWTNKIQNPVIKGIGEDSKYNWVNSHPESPQLLNENLQLVNWNSIFDINKERWGYLSTIMKMELLKKRISSFVCHYRY